MKWKQAWMDSLEGYSRAHIEKLPDGKRAVVGTFKGLRAFHDARKGTSVWMMYRGLVEEGSTLYRVEVFANVRIQTRIAKFTSVNAFTLQKVDFSQMHPTIHPTRFTAAQRVVLDAVGDALKRRLIDFCTATELGDRVKAGQANEVRVALNELVSTDVQPSDLLEFDSSDN